MLRNYMRYWFNLLGSVVDCVGKLGCGREGITLCNNIQTGIAG
jgi:hypothetical protein